MKENTEIEPYDSVEVPRARIGEFLHEPFDVLMQAAEREGFVTHLKTTKIDCPMDTALLRNARWTDKPLVLKQNW